MPGASLPEGVATELKRLVHRWQQLPLDRALARTPLVRALVDDLAGESVPDHGPAVVLDQLRVVAYDACRSGSADPTELARRLADLRREID